MSKTAALGSATSKKRNAEGKVMDVPRTNSFATGVKPENANGAQIVKGKAQIIVGSADVNVKQFEDYSEVRAMAGTNYEPTVLEWANDAARRAQLSHVVTKSRKLSIMPTGATSFVQGIFDAFTLGSLFEVATRASGKVAKSELATLAANAGAMSKEDLIAMIAKLAG